MDVHARCKPGCNAIFQHFCTDCTAYFFNDSRIPCLCKQSTDRHCCTVLIVFCVIGCIQFFAICKKFFEFCLIGNCFFCIIHAAPAVLACIVSLVCIKCCICTDQFVLDVLFCDTDTCRSIGQYDVRDVSGVVQVACCLTGCSIYGICLGTDNC